MQFIIMPQKRARGEDEENDEDEVVLPRDLADLSGPSPCGFLPPRLGGDKLAALALTGAEVDKFNEDDSIYWRRALGLEE